MNKVFAAFWYSGILPLLSCTTTTPTTTTTTTTTTTPTTTTTTFENHESLSRPQSAKKEGTKAKQNRKQNREKQLEKKDKKKGFPQIRWLKDQWRKSKKEKQEVLEMDPLEAELESELQKLPGCSTEASGLEGKISDICEFNTDIHVQDSGVFVTEEGECASSVLTEEPQQEVLEMDRLEAELKSELQKLPWCSTEASGFEGKISDICENEDTSFEGFYKPDGQTSDSCQLSGVLPSELDQKLCHLLIEQQESQIVGLESELHWAQSKLHEKEAELQALKDCVKSLTEFSLATASDEESEAQKEEEKIIDHGDYDNKMGPESKRSVVGMKRSMDFEPYSCDMK